MLVNGISMNCDESKVICDLLSKLNLNLERVVVEVNGEIIPKERFKTQKLKENDVIEVISFVGGG